MKFLNLGKRKKKQSKKEKKVKTLVYNSLDELPLYSWNKVYDTKDFRFILVNATPQNIDTLPYHESDLVYGWEKLYDEYLNTLEGEEKKDDFLNKYSEYEIFTPITFVNKYFNL